MKYRLLGMLAMLTVALSFTTSAFALNLSSFNYSVTLNSCSGGVCIGSGTLSFSGHLNDSSCTIGIIIDQPSTTITTMNGSIGLTNYRTQSPTTCPDAKAIAQYMGAAQGITVDNSFFTETGGVYEFGFSMFTESSGVSNGDITTFVPGLTSWNPLTPNALSGSCTVDSLF